MEDNGNNKEGTDKNNLLAVLQLLRKYNLKNTEELFKKEVNLANLSVPEETPQTDSEVSSVLSAYKNEGDPEVYEDAYAELYRGLLKGLLTYTRHFEKLEQFDNMVKRVTKCLEMNGSHVEPSV